MKLKGFSFIFIILLLGWVLQPAPVCADGYVVITCDAKNSVVTQAILINSPEDAVVEVLSLNSVGEALWKKYVVTMTMNGGYGFWTFESIEGYTDSDGKFMIQLANLNMDANVTLQGICKPKISVDNSILYLIGAGFGVLFIIFLMKVMT